jgi:branched-subunit amino acid aminotransferase/4-amino-4-deoxychorismate lyase
MSSYVMINGHILPEMQAQLPALDRGFLYGDCIYEVFSAKNGLLIDFEYHLDRLRKSAEIHEIPVPWSNQLIRFDIDHMLSLDNPEYASIRLVVSRGIGGALVPTEKLEPQRYLYVKSIAFPNYLPDANGIKLKTRRHPAVQRLLAAREGFDDILWMSHDGELIECGAANIFFLSREGDLVEIATPPLASGILPGVTRARIIELLTQAQIPVTERQVTIEELPRFDEAFVSSSIRLLRPVSFIDKHRLHTTRKNAVFWHIHRLYNSWLNQQTLSASEDSKH